MSDFRKSTVYQIYVKSFQDSDGQTLTVVTNCGKGAKPGPDPVLQPWGAFAVLK